MKKIILTESEKYRISNLYNKKTILREASPSPSELDLENLESTNLLNVSTLRGKTYGWRGPISSLCAQGKKDIVIGTGHAGRDYAVSSGNYLAALKSGTMIDNPYPNGFCFKIKFNDNSIGKFCHCDDVFIKTGENISAGQIFAKTGNKGPSTGPHLHFEYYPSEGSERTETKNNVTVNVKEVDPKGKDEDLFTFVRANKKNSFEIDVINKEKDKNIDLNDIKNIWEQKVTPSIEFLFRDKPNLLKSKSFDDSLNRDFYNRWTFPYFHFMGDGNVGVTLSIIGERKDNEENLSSYYYELSKGDANMTSGTDYLNFPLDNISKTDLENQTNYAITKFHEYGVKFEEWPGQKEFDSFDNNITDLNDL